MNAEVAPFELSSVIHLIRPAGRQARHLEDLRQGLAAASAACLFNHTLQCQLRHAASDIMPPDDFSSWVNGVVQDRETAERLSFAVQHHGGSPDEMRGALVEVLESMPEEKRIAYDAPAEGSFVFLEVESVAVPTGASAYDPGELMAALAQADPSVWFYHLVQQPWLEPRTPSLVDWARAAGDDKLTEWFTEVSESGRPLPEMRRRIIRRWRTRRLAPRLAHAASRTESERREAEREAVQGLVRRMTSRRGEDQP